MTDQFARTRMLLGSERVEKLARSRVAVIGLGGVGSYALEALVRGGVGAFELIDGDTLALTNLNRQILALHSTLGQTKVEAAAARVHDIDPEIRVRRYQTFYLPDTRAQFDFSAYDYVVDCIDTVTAKLDLVLQCQNAGTPIISALGTGNKLDPSKLELADIYDTAVCPLARVMRKELRRRGVKRLQVLYSREEPVSPRFQPEPEDNPELLSPDAPESYGNQRRSVPGSSPFVPPAAGLLIASFVVRKLLSSVK